jgi:hypothetical protein
LLKNGIKIALLFLFLLPSLHIEGKPRTEKQIDRLEAQKARKEKKDYEKRRKEAVKQRYSIQTQEVQDRMKESKKKADNFNKSKKDPFFKELFKKKRKKKYKSKKRPK